MDGDINIKKHGQIIFIFFQFEYLFSQNLINKISSLVLLLE
jgi:hypothetical protein